MLNSKTIFACLGVLVASLGHAHAQACSAIDINVCPTLFSERCQTDDDFSAANALQCVKVLSGSAVDAAECSAIDMTACTPQSCEESRSGIETFFCERGKSQCTINGPQLASEFDALLSELDARLMNYQQVIDLDISEVSDRNALCGFSLDELDKFRSQAVENSNLLDAYDEQIQGKKSCAGTLGDYMKSERDPEIPAELWQDVTDMLRADLTEISLREGVIRSQVEKLAAAPQKLNALIQVHQIACPQK